MDKLYNLVMLLNIIQHLERAYPCQDMICFHSKIYWDLSLTKNYLLFFHEDPISIICIIVLTNRHINGHKINDSLAEVTIVLKMYILSNKCQGSVLSLKKIAKVLNKCFQTQYFQNYRFTAQVI